MNKIKTSAFVLALAGTIAVQAPAEAATTGIVLDNGKPILFVQGSGAAATAAPSAPNYPAITANFARLYPKGEYNATTGGALAGVHTIQGQIWLASAFTPTRNTMLHKVEVAAGYIFGTKNLVAIHLYADAAGLPGTELWTRETALPPFPSCCALVTLPDATGVPLTAGTRYWLGITTVPGGTDTMAEWNLVTRNQVTASLFAQNRGTGWQPGSEQPKFAFALYGN